MCQLPHLLLALAVAVSAAAQTTTTTTNNQVTTTTTTTTVTQTTVEKQQKTWVPFRVCVLPFTTIEQKAHKRFLQANTQRISVPTMNSLSDADHASVDSVMQGFVKLVDAYDQAATNDANRNLQLQDNEFEQAKMLKLYQTVATGAPRPVVIGADYLEAALGQHHDVFACTSADQMLAAMRLISGYPDFPRNFMLRLAHRANKTTHLITGTVSDLRVTKTTFKGYGIVTNNLRYDLDLIVKMYDLATQATVHTQTYTASETIRLTPNVTVTNLDDNTFDRLMHAAINEAAEELYSLCKPGPDNRISVSELPPDPDPPITKTDVQIIVDAAKEDIQNTASTAQTAIAQNATAASAQVTQTAQTAQTAIAQNAQQQRELNARLTDEATTAIRNASANATQNAQNAIAQLLAKATADLKLNSIEAQRLLADANTALAQTSADITKAAQNAIGDLLAKAAADFKLRNDETQRLLAAANYALTQTSADVTKAAQNAIRDTLDDANADTTAIAQNAADAIRNATDNAVKAAHDHLNRIVADAAKDMAHGRELADAVIATASTAIQQTATAISTTAQNAVQQNARTAQEAIAQSAQHQRELNAQLLAEATTAIRSASANATQTAQTAIGNLLEKATADLKLSADESNRLLAAANYALTQSADDVTKAAQNAIRNALDDASKALADANADTTAIAQNAADAIRNATAQAIQAAQDNLSRIVADAAKDMANGRELANTVIASANVAIRDTANAITASAQNAIRQTAQPKAATADTPVSTTSQPAPAEPSQPPQKPAPQATPEARPTPTDPLPEPEPTLVNQTAQPNQKATLKEATQPTGESKFNWLLDSPLKRLFGRNKQD